MKMEFETIIVSKENGIATAILNRPERLNALNKKAVEELSLLIRSVSEDEKTKVLVITGAGRAFCVGADFDLDIFKAGSPIQARIGMSLLYDLSMKLRALPKPVIASVNGVAAGGGANMALACDMIVASEKASFSQVFINVGLHVDTGGTYFLPWAVGVPKAMELMMTGDFISATEAERIGMINRVVAAEKLKDATVELAQKLAGKPPIALSMIKASVYHNLTGDLASALEREADCQAILLNSEDNREGIRALQEKRKPIFKGQ